MKQNNSKGDVYYVITISRSRRSGCGWKAYSTIQEKKVASVNEGLIVKDLRELVFQETKSGTNETMLMLELKEDLILTKGNYKRPRIFKGVTDNVEKVVLFKKVNSHFIYQIARVDEVIDKLQKDLGSKIIQDGKVRTDLRTSAATNMLGQLL